MQPFSFLLRVGILFAAGYILLTANTIMGFVIFGTGLFSFVFKLRSPLFLTSSQEADFWEFFGVGLIFANGLIIGFADYNDPSYTWLDIPMHVAGGIFVALWTNLAFDEILKKSGRVKRLLLSLGIVALVGIGWELYEWIYDHSLALWYALPQAQTSLNDTIGDLLFDLLGGLGVIIPRLFNKKSVRS